jgi:hypothetical protein
MAEKNGDWKWGDVNDVNKPMHIKTYVFQSISAQWPLSKNVPY